MVGYTIFFFFCMAKYVARCLVEMPSRKSPGIEADSLECADDFVMQMGLDVINMVVLF